MFERYTEAARRSLFFARYEASQLGSLSIESEHLLLGLLREISGPLARVLRDLPFTDIREDIVRGVTRQAVVSTSVEIPFSAATKNALRYAAEEADGLGHAHIGTEHLLLGLLHEPRSMAAHAVLSRGLSLEMARERVGTAREAPVDVTIEEVRVHIARLLASFDQFTRTLEDKLDVKIAAATIREDIEQVMTMLDAL